MSVMTDDSQVPRAKEGDLPALPIHSGRLPPKNPHQRVLHYEAGRYAIVNKPADVRMDGDFTHTVEKLLADSVGISVTDIKFVHQLDYATSGVLMLGLSRVFAGMASVQFQRREIEKEYVALVHGHVMCEKGEDCIKFSEAIAGVTNGQGEKLFHMRAVQKGEEGKKEVGRAALTVAYPLSRGYYFGAKVTKIRLQPLSGRRHQLRVHCAIHGMPIVGDKTYCEDEGLFFERDFEPPRMMLHAMRLGLRLPAEGERIYGRKSALRRARRVLFSTDDPFIEEEVCGLVFEEQK